MTRQQREVTRLQQERFDEKADRGLEIKATLIAVGGTVWADQAAFLVWYQTVSGSTPDTVLCRSVSPAAELSVILGYRGQSQVLEVLRVDENAEIQTTNYDTKPHNHGPGQPNMLWVHPEVLVPLSIYPSTTGLVINVVAGSYNFFGIEKTFAGATSVNLASFQPTTGNHRLVGLYLDASNTLQTVAGTIVAVASDPPEPSWPVNIFKIGAVLLNGDQTTISFANDITNRKLLWSVLDRVSSSGVMTVNNGSGATANVGDVGYIDSAGDYQTTITANDKVEWAVVTVEGADATDIEVARSGRRTVNYTGTDPSAGDFLITSATAGKAQQQTTMRPEVFAICTAGGSGGVVEALLYTGRTFVPLTSDRFIIRVDSHSGTDFTATIAALSGANVEYTVTGGTNEDSIVPATSPQLGKIVLHNTTRGDDALIDSVNTTNTATPADGTITLTATAPVGWAVSDVITTRSQTNTATAAGVYFFDIDFSDADNDTVPELAVFIFVEGFQLDSGGTPVNYIHSYEAFAGSKTRVTQPQVTNKSFYASRQVMLIDRRFCWLSSASGAATCITFASIFGAEVATP